MTPALVIAVIIAVFDVAAIIAVWLGKSHQQGQQEGINTALLQETHDLLVTRPCVKDGDYWSAKERDRLRLDNIEAKLEELKKELHER